MCVIIVSPSKKVRPTLGTLRLCASSNPHGSGLAWLEDGRVSWLKGLTPEAIHENILRIDGPVVIHFRYATVGGRREELCHPFPITEEAKPKSYGHADAVLFHNGHWSDWESFLENNAIELNGPISDSRVIAIGTYLGGKEWLETIPGRFVIFDEGGAKLFGDWTKLRGMQFSNLNWRAPLPAPKVASPVPKQKTFEPITQELRDRLMSKDAMICYGD